MPENRVKQLLLRAAALTGLLIGLISIGVPYLFEEMGSDSDPISTASGSRSNSAAVSFNGRYLLIFDKRTTKLRAASLRASGSNTTDTQLAAAAAAAAGCEADFEYFEQFGIGSCRASAPPVAELAVDTAEAYGLLKLVSPDRILAINPAPTSQPTPVSYQGGSDSYGPTPQPTAAPYQGGSIDPLMRSPASPSALTYDCSVPAAPFSSAQYHLGEWNQRLGANIYNAWCRTSRKKPVTVGVLDTGLNPEAPDLQSQVWANPGEIPSDGLDNDHNQIVDDYFNRTGELPMCPIANDHGTQVASVIGANGRSLLGAAPNAKLMFLEIPPITSTNSLLQALFWPWSFLRDPENGFDLPLVNLSSYSGDSDTCYQEYKSVYTSLSESQILVIQSAGNQGQDLESFPLPDLSCIKDPAVDNLISVAATSGYYPGLAPFSNFGRDTVSLAAPGQGIGAARACEAAPAFVDGTSFAAPVVSGVLALLYGEYPWLTVRTAKEILFWTARHVPALDGKLVHPAVPDAAAMLDYAAMQFHPAIRIAAQPAPVFYRTYEGKLGARFTVVNDGDVEFTRIKAALDLGAGALRKVRIDSGPTNPGVFFPGIPRSVSVEFSDVPSSVSTVRLGIDPDNELADSNTGDNWSEPLALTPGSEAPASGSIPAGVPYRAIPGMTLQIPLRAPGEPPQYAYQLTNAPHAAAVLGDKLVWTPAEEDIGVHDLRALVLGSGGVPQLGKNFTVSVERPVAPGQVGATVDYPLRDYANLRGVRDQAIYSGFPGFCQGKFQPCFERTGLTFAPGNFLLNDVQYVRLTLNTWTWQQVIPSDRFISVDVGSRARGRIFDILPYFEPADQYFTPSFGTLKFVERDDDNNAFGSPSFRGWPRSWGQWIAESADRGNDKRGMGVRIHATAHIGTAGPEDHLTGAVVKIIDDAPGDFDGVLQLAVKLKSLNAAPVIDVGGPAAGAEGSPMSFQLHGTDTDDEELIYGAENLPAGATLDPKTGVFNWTPAYGQFGSYQIRFFLSDGATSSSATKQLAVARTECPPVITHPGTLTAYIATLFSFTLNIRDPHGDPYTCTALNIPPNAEFNPSSCTLTWLLPGTGTFQQSYNVTFSATNSHNLSTSIVVPIKTAKLSSFLPGTVIALADGRTKEIQTISPGDVVVSYHERSGTFSKGTVTRLFHHLSDWHIRINERIAVTAEHPFYVEGHGWKKAGSLMLGDHLKRGDGGTEPITSLTRLDISSEVYNFEVDGFHTYVAAGVVAHNKPQPENYTPPRQDRVLERVKQRQESRRKRGLRTRQLQLGKRQRARS